MIVADSSAIVDALSGSEATARLLYYEVLWAPHLVEAEVGQAIRRRWVRGLLTEDRATAAVAQLAELDIALVEHRILIRRAWELRHDVTFTDGLYVALAERLRAPLVTLDARLAGAPGIRATVQVPGRR